MTTMENKELEELKYELVQACKILDRLQVSLHTGYQGDRPNHVECRERILDAMSSLDKIEIMLGITSSPKIEEGMVKVNVWQLGYSSYKDYLSHDQSKAELRPRGYVVVEDNDYWFDEVWNLLNWGCWSYDEDNMPVKPKGVHSTLDHCNSDIIVNIEGTDKYMFAKSVGWGSAHSLEDAVKNSKAESRYEYWPFPEVRKVSGSVKRKGEKIFVETIEGDLVEITW